MSPLQAAVVLVACFAAVGTYCIVIAVFPDLSVTRRAYFWWGRPGPWSRRYFAAGGVLMLVVAIACVGLLLALER
jgi:hypothetical protein